MTDFHKHPLTITLTPQERWALTKAILVSHYSADGTEGLEDDPEWTVDVELALETVFVKLNPQHLINTSDN